MNFFNDLVYMPWTTFQVEGEIEYIGTPSRLVDAHNKLLQDYAEHRQDNDTMLAFIKRLVDMGDDVHYWIDNDKVAEEFSELLEEIGYFLNAEK